MSARIVRVIVNIAKMAEPEPLSAPRIVREIVKIAKKQSALASAPARHREAAP